MLQSVVALSFWNLASISDLGVNCRWMSKHWFQPLLLALRKTHTPELRSLRLTLYGDCVLSVEFVQQLGAVLRDRGGLELVHLRFIRFSETNAAEALLHALWECASHLDVYICIYNHNQNDDQNDDHSVTP